MFLQKRETNHLTYLITIPRIHLQQQHVYICCVHLQSKALRERWLLDGAPAEEETQKRLQEDEVKTKLLEQVILRSASSNLCMSDLH